MLVCETMESIDDDNRWLPRDNDIRYIERIFSSSVQSLTNQFYPFVLQKTVNWRMFFPQSLVFQRKTLSTQWLVDRIVVFHFVKLIKKISFNLSRPAACSHVTISMWWQCTQRRWRGARHRWRLTNGRWIVPTIVTALCLGEL